MCIDKRSPYMHLYGTEEGLKMSSVIQLKLSDENLIIRYKFMYW